MFAIHAHISAYDINTGKQATIESSIAGRFHLYDDAKLASRQIIKTFNLSHDPTTHKIDITIENEGEIT